MSRQPVTSTPDTERGRKESGYDADPLRHALRRPWPEHLAALTILTSLLILRWWKYFTWPMPLNDEMTYFRAANALLHGRTAYQPGYLYPELPAYLSALAIRHIGVTGWTFTLRLLNDLGAALMGWLSVSWIPWSWWRRMALGAALILLSPAVHFAIFTAHLSLAIGGVLTLALLLWPTAPITSGAMLGLSIGLKPLAPGAVAILGLHRPENAKRKNAWLSAGAACIIGVGLLVVRPGIRQLLRLPLDQIDPMSRTVSLHRITHLLGWGARPALVSLVLLVAALLWTRRSKLNVSETFGAAAATTLAITPIVWAHTMIITLPIQVLALARSVRRLRQAGAPDAARRRRYELVFVLLACAAIQFAEGASAVYHVWPLWQVAAVLPPILAPAALTVYLVHTRKADGLRSSQRGQAAPR